MIKKFCLVFISVLLSVSISIPLNSEIFKNKNFGKSMNMLFVLKDVSDVKDSKVKFFIVKYDTADNFIKICFADENIVVFQKNRKYKTLKDVFFETGENMQIETAKKEIQKVFNNELQFDIYVLFDEKFLKKAVSIFSKSEDLSNNIGMLDIVLNSNTDRYTFICACVKVLNYVYSNINRWNIINLLKSFYKRDFVFRTNFRLRDLLLAYPKLLNENKSFKYADVPVINKKNILTFDKEGIGKIIEFFDEDVLQKYDENDLQIEVLNATDKSRLAIKAANKIREHSIDVLDWGSSSKRYRFTVIFDFINIYNKSLEIKNILNCGEIIFKPEERQFTNISVLLGNDCTIYDKLDREY